MTRTLLVRLPLVLLAALAGLAPVVALAHPLGNFTVNRYSRIEVTSGTVRILHVLDIAEIPAVQEQQAADADRSGTVSDAEWDGYRARKVAEVQRGLELTLDGRPVPLLLESSSVSTSPGQANLRLIRLEATFRGDWSGADTHRATFRDRNEPTRVGWREIVVRAGAGVEITQSSAATDSVSNELRAYPETLLQSPLNQREADWRFSGAGAGSAAARSPAAAPQSASGRPSDPFTELIAAADLNPGVILLAVLASAVLGGIHGASPGHGKTVMAAYIVGTRGTFVHALALAGSVTFSHTAGVLLLGGVVVLASNTIVPEQLYPWLTLASGAIVLVIGLGLLVRASLDARASRRARSLHDHRQGHDLELGHAHDGAHGHTHTHAHTHGDGPGQHRHDLPITWRNLFALGLAGGIVPSASALVVLLSALALGRLGFGLLLIVAFGAGMGIVLTATGFLLVYAARLVARYFPDTGSPLQRRLTRAVPFVSALTMAVVGVAVTLQAIGQFGYLRA